MIVLLLLCWLFILLPSILFYVCRKKCTCVTQKLCDLWRWYVQDNCWTIDHCNYSRSIALFALSLPFLSLLAFVNWNLHTFIVKAFLQKWKKVLLRKTICKVLWLTHCYVRWEKMLSLFLCQYPLKQGWQTCDRRTVSVAPNTLQIVFSSTMFPTLDSSATALAAACLLMTCLPQKHLAASSAIKV